MGPPEDSSTGTGEKPSISRSLSLTKIFTPRIKRASSLPLDEIRQSNNESSQGGSVGGPLNVRFSNAFKFPFSRVISFAAESYVIKKLF